MPKIKIVVGLGASGKSTYCRTLAQDPYDDFLDMSLAPARTIEGVIQRLRDGYDVVANDIDLCRVVRREEIVGRLETESPGVVMEWVYFENNPIQCIFNALADYFQERGHEPRARINSIRRISGEYVIPAGGEVLPVVGPTNL